MQVSIHLFQLIYSSCGEGAICNANFTLQPGILLINLQYHLKKKISFD